MSDVHESYCLTIHNLKPGAAPKPTVEPSAGPFKVLNGKSGELIGGFDTYNDALKYGIYLFVNQRVPNYIVYE